MKVLKLTTSYSSLHTDVDGHVLMPVESNGTIFGQIPLNMRLEEAVGLGELEGKYSYCRGDLIAEVIDISEMNPVHLQYLIKDSDYGLFEGFFENSEYELKGYLEELKMKDEMSQYNKIKLNEKEIYENLGMEPLEEETYSKSSKVYDKFSEKLTEYVAPRKVTELNILESEAERIKVLLLQNGFEFFE